MTAVLLDYGSAKTKAQAHAFCLGGKEGREQLLRNVWRNSDPHVNDGKLNPAMRVAGRCPFNLKR
jgi:hypothetical protein